MEVNDFHLDEVAPHSLFRSNLCHRANQRLHQVMLIFKPDTVLRWHRRLVRRKWIFRQRGKPGRPKIASELEALIVGLAQLSEPLQEPDFRL